MLREQREHVTTGVHGLKHFVIIVATVKEGQVIPEKSEKRAGRKSDEKYELLPNSPFSLRLHHPSTVRRMPAYETGRERNMTCQFHRVGRKKCED
ncbi:hypothetical protein GJ744_000576 [Endocarpon pusillum]|uniref:Uncharacterized protein n=1 Tax=Endocarpon pusillum TaxID=364733 RepID=A0A8H7AEH8_9EURO|nr:hypothetical protein GJ744_000576 [Endocarpon pusillum]